MNCFVYEVEYPFLQSEIYIQDRLDKERKKEKKKVIRNSHQIYGCQFQNGCHSICNLNIK